MKAINLVNSSTVNSREGSDFYPTPPDVTHALMKFLKLPSENYTIWEPACGDGSMSKVLSEYCEIDDFLLKIKFSTFLCIKVQKMSA